MSSSSVITPEDCHNAATTVAPYLLLVGLVAGAFALMYVLG